MSQAESGWSGRAGYVQAALKEDGVKVAKNTGALMCGMKGMAEEVSRHTNESQHLNGETADPFHEPSTYSIPSTRHPFP